MKVPVNVLQAGLLTSMAFMDQIIARHSLKLQAEGKENVPPTVIVGQQEPKTGK